jgi:hypothetical protein
MSLFIDKALYFTGGENSIASAPFRSFAALKRQLRIALRGKTVAADA